MSKQKLSLKNLLKFVNFEGVFWNQVYNTVMDKEIRDILKESGVCKNNKEFYYTYCKCDPVFKEIAELEK